MFGTVLFDLDGTLTDPGTGITNSVSYALGKFGITVENRSELYCFIGPPLFDSFRDRFGFTPEKCEKAISYYREYFSAKGIYENEIYADTEEMLRTIKNSGRKIVLATSKPEKFANIILRYFHIDGYFDFIAGAEMDHTRDKKAEVIAYALDRTGVTDLSDAVMIGDRSHDIEGAKAVGIASVGVLYGYGSEKELRDAGADYIAKKAKDIISFL
ncbi:MAG: HAD family hydrolase [Ruminiclostridium sp.]|nr:HAD family hydrolase [Ruminiclostridium sp.]